MVRIRRFEEARSCTRRQDRRLLPPLHRPGSRRRRHAARSWARTTTSSPPTATTATPSPSAWTPKRLMAELYGKATGCSKGKGGSMHYLRPRSRFLGRPRHRRRPDSARRGPRLRRQVSGATRALRWRSWATAPSTRAPCTRPTTSPRSGSCRSSSSSRTTATRWAPGCEQEGAQRRPGRAAAGPAQVSAPASSAASAASSWGFGTFWVSATGAGLARAGACGTTGTGATTTGRGATRAFGVVERGVLRVVARAERVVVDVAVGWTSATFCAAGRTAVGAGGAVAAAAAASETRSARQVRPRRRQPRRRGGRADGGRQDRGGAPAAGPAPGAVGEDGSGPGDRGGGSELGRGRSGERGRSGGRGPASRPGQVGRGADQRRRRPRRDLLRVGATGGGALDAHGCGAGVAVVSAPAGVTAVACVAPVGGSGRGTGPCSGTARGRRLRVAGGGRRRASTGVGAAEPAGGWAARRRAGSRAPAPRAGRPRASCGGARRRVARHRTRPGSPSADRPSRVWQWQAAQARRAARWAAAVPLRVAWCPRSV